MSQTVLYLFPQIEQEFPSSGQSMNPALSSTATTAEGSSEPPQVQLMAQLSELKSTMPTTNTFLPDLMLPVTCPQNGTICHGKCAARTGEPRELFKGRSFSFTKASLSIVDSTIRRMTRGGLWPAALGRRGTYAPSSGAIQGDPELSRGAIRALAAV